MTGTRQILTLIGLTLGHALSGAAPAQNAIADWHAITESTVVGTAKKSPSVAYVYFAYVDVAMYDAVNAIGGHFKPFAVETYAPPGASQDAAAATAARDVLVHYFSGQALALNADWSASMAAIADGQAKTDGISVGHAVAAQWLSLRTGDGLEAPVAYVWGHGPGIWEPVPTFPAPPPNTPPAPVAPWQAQFKPFALLSADQFLADVPPPPSLTSATFTRDSNQTKDYGALNSSVRTPEQTEIGRFWTDNPAAQFSRSLRALIASQGLDTARAARLGAMSFVALADSVTACFNAKYHFAFWRPYTAIHNADTDGNPDTVADPNWVPLAVTPGHPEYPAAHGCGTEALMDTLTEFFETEEIPFTVTSTVTGTTHAFNNFEDVVTEVDNARIYGGMHFHHSVKEGNRLGRRVADYVLRTQFRPKDE